LLFIVKLLTLKQEQSSKLLKMPLNGCAKNISRHVIFMEPRHKGYYIYRKREMNE